MPRIYGPNDATAIEDFVEPESYIRAVNEELKRSHGKEFQVKIPEICGPNTSKLLEEWCKSKGISSPSKRAIAYRLVESRYDYPLVRSDAVQQLRELYKSIKYALGFDLS